MESRVWKCSFGSGGPELELSGGRVNVQGLHPAPLSNTLSHSNCYNIIS